MAIETTNNDPHYKKCRMCHEEILQVEEICPYCKTPQALPWKGVVSKVLGIILLIIFLIISILFVMR